MTARPLFRVVIAIVLSAAFLLIFAPLSLALRLIRTDPMQRQFDSDAATYRIASRHAGKESLHSVR